MSGGPGSASYSMTPAFFRTRANPQGLLCPSCVDWTLFARISLDVALCKSQLSNLYPFQLEQNFNEGYPSEKDNAKRIAFKRLSNVFIIYSFTNIISFDTSTDAKRAPVNNPCLWQCVNQERHCPRQSVLGPNELWCSKMRRHKFQQKVSRRLQLILLTTTTDRVGKEADLHLLTWLWPWAWVGSQLAAVVDAERRKTYLTWRLQGHPFFSFNHL